MLMSCIVHVVHAIYTSHERSQCSSSNHAGCELYNLGSELESGSEYICVPEGKATGQRVTAAQWERYLNCYIQDPACENTFVPRVLSSTGCGTKCQAERESYYNDRSAVCAAIEDEIECIKTLVPCDPADFYDGTAVAPAQPAVVRTGPVLNTTPTPRPRPSSDDESGGGGSSSAAAIGGGVGGGIVAIGVLALVAFLLVRRSIKANGKAGEQSKGAEGSMERQTTIGAASDPPASFVSGPPVPPWVASSYHGQYPSSHGGSSYGYGAPPPVPPPGFSSLGSGPSQNGGAPFVLGAPSYNGQQRSMVVTGSSAHSGGYSPPPGSMMRRQRRSLSDEQALARQVKLTILPGSAAPMVTVESSMGMRTRGVRTICSSIDANASAAELLEAQLDFIEAQRGNMLTRSIKCAAGPVLCTLALVCVSAAVHCGRSSCSVLMRDVLG